LNEPDATAAIFGASGAVVQPTWTVVLLWANIELPAARKNKPALWAFERSHSFAEGALLAVNLGDDADTTGAVYGQLAGAYYGEQDIPDQWVARLAHLDLIVTFADRLVELAEALPVDEDGSSGRGS